MAKLVQDPQVESRCPHLLAFWTYQGALVLPLEKVDNDAVIPFHITFPARSCELHEFEIAAAIPIRFLNIRFLEYAVEILVQPVQQKGNKLLGIVLLVPRELGSEA